MVECPQVVYLANLTKRPAFSSPQPHRHPNLLHPVWSQPDERPQPNSRGSCSEAQPAPRRSVGLSSLLPSSCSNSWYHPLLRLGHGCHHPHHDIDDRHDQGEVGDAEPSDQRECEQPSEGWQGALLIRCLQVSIHSHLLQLKRCHFYKSLSAARVALYLHSFIHSPFIIQSDRRGNVRTSR